jgi:hypothetical protein
MLSERNQLPDIPMILSGERFGILEPREEIFVIDGQVSPGMECTITELQHCPDQFLPFEKVTGNL